MDEYFKLFFNKIRAIIILCIYTFQPDDSIIQDTRAIFSKRCLYIHVQYIIDIVITLGAQIF